jgi:O-antigen/teichoic acid export membrane protein
MINTHSLTSKADTLRRYLSLKVLFMYLCLGWSHFGKYFSQFVMGKILLKALGFITVPLLTFYISQEEMGAYNLLTSCFNIMTVFFTLGTRQYFGIHFFKFSSLYNRLEITSRILWVYKHISLPLFALLALVMSQKISSEYLLVTLLFSLFFYLDIYNEIYMATLGFNQKFLKYNALSLIFASLQVLFLVIFVLFFNLHLLGIALAFLFAGIAQLSYSILTSKRHLSIISRIKKRSNNTNTKNIVSLIKPSLIFIPSALSFWLLMNIDQFMLNSMIGLKSVGLYGLASKFPTVFDTLISSSFIAVYTPKIYNKFRENISKGRKINTLIALLCFASSFLLYFIIKKCSFVIGYIVHDNYLPALDYIAPLMLAAMIKFSANILNMHIQFVNKIRFILYLNITTAVINAILNYLLIPKYGVQGCLIATVSSFTVMFAINLLKTIRLKNTKA